MRRVHIARDGGKQLDVALGDPFVKAGVVAHFNLCKRVVFQKIVIGLDVVLWVKALRGGVGGVLGGVLVGIGVIP